MYKNKKQRKGREERKRSENVLTTMSVPDKSGARNQLLSSFDFDLSREADFNL